MLKRLFLTLCLLRRLGHGFQSCTIHRRIPTAFLSAKDEQALEAIQALAEYHEGDWKGTTRSFTVTPDVAAGVIARKKSDPYTVSVSLSASPEKKGDYQLDESIVSADGVSTRSLSLTDSNTDIDAVDASYSLDKILPFFPKALSGTDKAAKFLVEHCLAVGENRRSRCWVLYGINGELIRVIVGDEERVTDASREASPTARDFAEDADRIVDRILESVDDSSSSKIEKTDATPQEKMERLQKALLSDDDTRPLEPYNMTLLELSSGVWLGDSVVRDYTEASERAGKGFETKSTPFATWKLGVQKVARRWMWNFEEQIRQVNDFGKGMGSELAYDQLGSVSGRVCLDESFSRMVPKDERMVYLDLEGDNVALFLGPHSVQVPRYLNFDQVRATKPFHSEFCTFQAADPLPGDATESDMEQQRDLVLSKIERTYNTEGRFRQGTTSFFTFKRFDDMKEEEKEGDFI